MLEFFCTVSSGHGGWSIRAGPHTIRGDHARGHSTYLSCVFSARSASVSHLSAISMKSDFCAEVRAASANRMHSAAFLRICSKVSKCASISFTFCSMSFHFLYVLLYDK